MKMHSLKRTAADRRADKDAGEDKGVMAMPANAEDDEGPVVHLEPHHLRHMGLGDKPGESGSVLPSRHPVEMKGHIETHSVTGADGKLEHRATVRLTHAGVDIPEEKRGEGLREELGKNMEDSERRSVEREEKRVARKDRGGKEDRETVGGTQ